MRNRCYALLAWANFALLAAAALKFIPIIISLTHGIHLSSEQIAAGLEMSAPGHRILFPTRLICCSSG